MFIYNCLVAFTMSRTIPITIKKDHKYITNEYTQTSPAVGKC